MYRQLLVDFVYICFHPKISPNALEASSITVAPSVNAEANKLPQPLLVQICFLLTVCFAQQ
jgi:hypothetical protein